MTTTETETSARVAALTTHTGEVLIIRGNPSKDEVRAFVAEHNKRYHEGEPGGPDGLPSYLIKSAAFHAEELAVEPDAGEEIDISDLQ